ncbi:hypothetical protein [Dactylosporangium darangshiense]|uniref:hypothetical protein n=1 Tax=Dactylosporangium darangshiense TaxID=579108 RepID=UPI0031E7EFFE
MQDLRTDWTGPWAGDHVSCVDMLRRLLEVRGGLFGEDDFGRWSSPPWRRRA